MYLILILIFLPLGYIVLLLGKKKKNSEQDFSLLFFFFFFTFYFPLMEVIFPMVSLSMILLKKIEEPLSTCMSACLEASLTHATLNGRGLKHLSRI